MPRTPPSEPSPPNDPIRQLLDQLDRVRPAGDGWTARCPAHEDKTPSLSITVADSGKILLFCHAGCDTTDVIRAAGFEASLLNGTDTSTQPKRKAKKPQTRPNKKAAIAAAARSANGKAVAEYDYVDDQGVVEFSVVRISQPKGKTFRPIHPVNGRWRLGDPEGLLPLLNLPEIITSDGALVVEGEGCVQAAADYGITATTSAHGAKSAHKSDWRALQGKDITIWPDNDEPGRKYAQDVVDELRRLDPEARIRFVAPEGLPEGGDIVDWLEARTAEGVTQEDLSERLAILLEGAAAFPDVSEGNCAGSAGSAGRGPQSRWPDPKPIDERQPLPSFPIELAFPPHLEWVKDYASAIAECHQVPIDAVVMLLLPTMALGLAKRFEVEPQPGWREQMSLYVVVLLPSGERKTAVMRHLTSPIYDWQHEIATGMADEIRRIQNEEQVVQNRLDRARRKAAASQSGDLDDLDELTQNLAEIEAKKPNPPTLLVTEGTSEAIARTLMLNNERAMLAAAEGDALDVMLGRYSGSPNFGVWLAGHSGDSIDSVRRGREADRLTHPALQVALSIQPEAISDLLGSRAANGRGVLARFFFSAPTSKVGFRKLQTDAVPTALVDRFGTRMQQNLSIVVPSEPEIIRLTPEAHELFIAYRERNEIDLRPDGGLALVRSWGSKLPGGLARIAGVLRMFDASQAREIDAQTLQCALALHDYLLAHYTHVSTLAGDDEVVDIARRIDAWIRRKSIRSFTMREAFDKVRTKGLKADDIGPALQLLEERDRIRALQTPEGRGPGRPPSPSYEVNPALLGKGVPRPQNPQNPHNSAEEGAGQ